MASIKIQSSSSGGGSITLTAPNTSSNRTVTLPDEDVTLGGGFPAQAWANINGTNGSIRGNGNVSSVTDNGSSRFTVNYTNSISSADCSVTASVSNTSYSYLMGVDMYSFGTANCSLRTHDYNSLQDVTYLSVTVHV
tara:strand:- start:929 stop:1339 length:411 start_codon:yes stop_codon:yes gene_type:complete